MLRSVKIFCLPCFVELFQVPRVFLLFKYSYSNYDEYLHTVIN